MRRYLPKPPRPFWCFNSSPEVIRLVVMMCVSFALSLRNVEDLVFERGIDICHGTVRLWWNRFGPLFAGDIRHLVDRQTYKLRRLAALADSEKSISDHSA
jgi:hypothetical protein